MATTTAPKTVADDTAPPPPSPYAQAWSHHVSFGLLSELAPNKQMPWRFSDVVEQRAAGAPSVPAPKLVLLEGSDPEWAFVYAYFQQSCPLNRQISRIFAIAHPSESETAFATQVRNQSRECTMPAFTPRWTAMPSPPAVVAAREAVHRRWLSMVEPWKASAAGTSSSQGAGSAVATSAPGKTGTPSGSSTAAALVAGGVRYGVLPLWAPAPASLSPSLPALTAAHVSPAGLPPSTSFLPDISSRDHMGKGFYLTTSARVATESTLPESASQSAAAGGEARGHDEDKNLSAPSSFLVLHMVAMRAPYPVLGHNLPTSAASAASSATSTVASLSAPTEDIALLKGKGSVFQNYNAHYAPLYPLFSAMPHSSLLVPCPPQAAPVADEFAIFNRLQILPRFVVELSVSLSPPLSLSLSAAPTQASAKEMMERLFQNFASITSLLNPEDELVDYTRKIIIILATRREIFTAPMLQKILRQSEHVAHEGGHVHKAVCQRLQASLKELKAFSGK